MMQYVRRGAAFVSSWTLLQTLITTQNVSARSMCSILDQRTTIVGNRLFFSSGNYTFDDDGLGIHNTSSLYWLSLNDTIDVSGPIDLNSLGAVDLPSDSLTGGTSPESGGAAGTFFYDHTTLYPYAGLVGPEANGINNALWAFNSTDDSWDLIEVSGGKISFGNNSEGVHASDPRTGTSFYTGGWKMAYNSTNNGTVKFQSFNSDSPQWTFETATSGIQGPDILKGAMVYLRKGQAGVLVAFGGYQTAYEGVEFAGWPWDRRPFSEIFIYDIFSNTWYQQTATGDLPDLRTEFCAGVSSAPDDTSFQITIHGGWDQLGGRAFNDVYVLSIPSFRWIKIDDSNNPDLLGDDQPGRNRHKCDVWNESQLIVTGGQITLGYGETVSLSKTCNTTYPPIKVLDTSTYTWRTEFDPSIEYSVPNVVSAVIGGNSSGAARLTTPSGGWDSGDLSAIFKQTVARDTLSAGAIAGIVVGVVVGLAAIAAAVFFFRRRNNRTHNVSVTAPAPGTGDNPAFGFEPLGSERWNKPELDGTTGAARYELGEHDPAQLHGDSHVVHEMYVDDGLDGRVPNHR
ncbi:hypothetical protein NPX13_g5017 [Xylaria arbuscula]|uniref:Kelch repeat protein n=1 Tax=Xylaria arbuscula TaxID=114810 RepID=A0A9W8NFA4_9PEZI|nr:hypothetical protein NPX13_g5017 [Xylaria arbuscula]